LLALTDNNPTVARLLAARGFADPVQARRFIDAAYYTPAAPEELPDVLRAVELLRAAIEAKQKVLIWGDFDVDGQTATALLREALTPLLHTELFIPDRLNDGHGVPLARLQEQLERYQPQLLVTCDTGITAFEAVDLAKRRGLTVIITDHHLPEGHLPTADAVINPHRLPASHPLGGLPGVGVAYILVRALYSQLGLNPERSLDLVALGIVADVAPQSGDTRYYLQRGLHTLRTTQRIGLLKLIEVAGLDRYALTEEEIGFQLGPRLNAAGRIGSARTSVDLLTTDQTDQALVLAQALDGLNLRRRTLQRETEAEIAAQLAADPTLLDYAALVLYGAEWHGGILGPVAGRLAEKYQRPAILLSRAGVFGTVARGSARSVAGVNLAEAFNQLDSLLLSHGGHEGAAGLSLEIEKIGAFRRALSQHLAKTKVLRAETPLTIDATLPLGEANLDFVRILNRLAPFGEGNPAPVFRAENVLIHRAEFLDRAHEHRHLTVFDADGETFFVYWWGSGDQEVPTGAIDLAYTISLKPGGIVTYTLVDFQAREAAALPAPVREVIDLRQSDPAAALRYARAQFPDLAVWSDQDETGTPLRLLEAGKPLAIYSIPPSQKILQTALEQLDPPAVILIGATVAPMRWDALVKAIHGEVGKFKDAGEFTLLPLALRFSLTEAAAGLALELLTYIGAFAPFTIRDGHVLFGDGEAVQEMEKLKAKLPRFNQLLTEIEAWRVFFRTARPESLL
jgi:single-stranded-DNA-specific exonuclease